MATPPPPQLPSAFNTDLGNNPMPPYPGSGNTNEPGAILIGDINIHAPGGDPKTVKQATIEGLNEWEAQRSGYQQHATGLAPR